MKTFEHPIETYFGPLAERIDAMSLSFMAISEKEHEKFIATLRNGVFKAEKSAALEALNDLLAEIEALEKAKPIMPRDRTSIKSIYERTLEENSTDIVIEQIRRSYENGPIYRAYINELTVYKEELHRLIGRISIKFRKPKIRTHRTATELACKLKIETLTGILDDEGNSAALCRKIVTSFSSKKAIDMNEKAFYDAYVTPSLKDLLAIRQLYTDGLNTIDELIQGGNEKLSTNKKNNKK